ncbi:beta-1,4-mannanase [Ruegeria sp. HKCCD4884]|uniref:Z1 domain-containing protein n=1 Tax=Ruegeria sp. HKCCD4884 TaxID=2683022 RepID=UPI0014926021|nr:Z1 domain-containing protein [Ruegeria sp. HKCCD4884]NOD92510.1 beta-1,4-mannanase [Ruegeria sp. HKCCD4884]
MSSIADRYRERIEEYLRELADPDLEVATDKAREFFSPFGVDDELLGRVKEEIASELLERIRRIQDPYTLSKSRPHWYDEQKHRGVHWSALAGYLESEKGWGEEVVRSVSRSSAKVVAELGDPAEAEFDVRGLVVGYVQSGKTANMTGVIARAVDAGYNLVVVLAGTTDKLRHQTQARLEDDLIKRNLYNWQPLTSRNEYDSDGQLLESGDYQSQTANQLPNVAQDVAMIAVMKKLPAQLERLTSDIRKSPGLMKNRWRMLVIDDEADQASPNASKTDNDPTKTNRRIRELLAALPTVSYVGYTATPFANVLINPFPVGVTTEDEQSLEDLYPRDFLISLPRPRGYFGAEQIFGRDPVDAEDDGSDGLDVIRFVGAKEVRLLTSVDETPHLEDVESLREAVRWFLIAVAARLARGHDAAHASMLIHTSHRTDDHSDLEKLIQPEFERLTASPHDMALLKELEELWDRESAKVNPTLFENEMVGFDQIAVQLPVAAARLQIAVENSKSEDRLSYEGPPTAVIAIGGNILSRGLTLEGLTVTYFARRPKQYDTLLQMGRWFGYRAGYEDLVRLWMPEEVSNAFRQLALVEYELREEISEYAARGARPIDFAVRIRTLPGLQVTARNKSRHARTANIDYRGLHVQTIRFPRVDGDTLKRNWAAGARLVKQSGIEASGKLGRIESAGILEFLRDYSVHTSHRDLSSGWLEEYVRVNANILGEWSVGIFEPGDRAVGKARQPLGNVVPNLARRSRLEKTRDHEVADIKALMSRPDVMLDVPKEQLPDIAGWRGWEWARLKKWREDQLGQRPLLLLYPIDRNSVPLPKKDGTSKREPLDAVHDVLGLGIVFPQLGIDADRRPTKYIQVDLGRSSFADEDGEEAEGEQDAS